MKLGKKQELFARLYWRLLQHIEEAGYQVRLGETWRSKAAAEEYARRGIGIVNSVHRLKLAVDLNLFDQNGKYLTSIEDHLPFGVWWEDQHELTRWGGRFRRRGSGKSDPGHYSLEHNGVK